VGLKRSRFETSGLQLNGDIKLGTDAKETEVSVYLCKKWSCNAEPEGNYAAGVRGTSESTESGG